MEAYNGAASILAAHSRTNLVMACGSGKTLVGMRLAEAADRILMLEPSLALIRQALEEARIDGLLTGRTVICVCSDKTLASDDHWKVTDQELGLPVTTDSALLRAKLKESGHRCIVFCTYQSQALLCDSLPAGFSFDFGNFDEAHRTAGVRDRSFSVALSDDQIPIKKRLFLTATPRLFSEDESAETDIYSMDDIATYGPRAFQLTLGEAIERGIVCDYQILTACVSGEEVQKAVKRADSLLLPQKKLPVDLVAGQIAVVRAIQSVGARRVITFHATIDDAAAFTKDRLKLFKQAGIAAFHIHGNMPGRQRKTVINAFLSVDSPSILSNCHCLTEGVDVPEIDMVGIMCRKQSVQELVQALGRALRNRVGKERGYVMLPLYVNEHEPIESAIERCDLGVTWEILHSLLESDGELAEKLERSRCTASDGCSDTTSTHHRGHLRVVAPEALLEDLQRAISVRHIHRLGTRWEIMIAAAERYLAREGLLAVPIDHVEDDLPLGRWIEKQRHLRRSNRLSVARLQALGRLGMIWDDRDAKWAVGLKLAREFHGIHGHMSVPPTEKALRDWLSSTRQAAKSGRLPPSKLDAIAELGITLPQPRTLEAKLAALEKWRESHPEGRPQKHGPDRTLGFFLGYVTARYRSGKVDQATIERLAKMGFDIREIPAKRLTGRQLFGENSWDMHFQALKSYIDAHGWQPLWRDREHHGLPIHGWVAYQRLRKRAGTLPAEQTAALDALGIHWNRKTDWWLSTVEQLEAFYRDHGHFKLPRSAAFRKLHDKISNFRMRLQNGTASAELVARLAAINFPHTADEEYWQWAHYSLQQWREKHGVDALERPDLPAPLRQFLKSRKRVHRQHGLPAPKLAMLRALGVSWAVLDTEHTQMMARLTRLAREVGKANVEVMSYRDYQLREWLDTQFEAARQGNLSREAMRELRHVGIDVIDLSDSGAQNEPLSAGTRLADSF